LIVYRPHLKTDWSQALDPEVNLLSRKLLDIMGLYKGRHKFHQPLAAVQQIFQLLLISTHPSFPPSSEKPKQSVASHILQDSHAGYGYAGMLEAAWEVSRQAFPGFERYVPPKKGHLSQ